MKRVLVTGATGGLGRNAMEALLSRGIEVRATGRNPAAGEALSAMGAEFVPLDLAATGDSASAGLAALVRHVDAVWHCAALSSPWGKAADFTAANVTATRQLLQAAGHAGVSRFVHISTPALYFNYRAQLGIQESFRPAAYVNDYARTKAEAEACVQDAVPAFRHMHCSILRPRAIFGPYDQVLLPRIARVLRQRDGRLPLPHGGRVTLDLTYAGNVVQAMWLATTAEAVPSGSVFNITNQEPVLLRDVLAALFAQRLQRPFRIASVPYPMMAAAARGMEALARITQKEPVLTAYGVGALAFDMTLDNSRARQLLGYAPAVNLSDALDRTATWMGTHG